MIRRSFLPHGRPLLLLALLSMAAAAAPAHAQDAATQERLDRLERDLSMLQRQIYRGGPPAAVGTGAAVDTQVRMDRLEEQMRDLTGRVENATNAVEQLRQRLEQINSDIDVRFSQGQGQPGQGQPTQGQQPQDQSPQNQSGQVRPPRYPRGPALATRGAPPAPDAAVTPYGRRRPPDALEPPDAQARFGTLTPPGMPPGGGAPPGYLPENPAGNPPENAPGAASDSPYPGPTDLRPQTASAAAGGSLRPPGPEALPTGSTSAQYNSAFGLLRRADYPAAEDALRSFVQQHPTDPLAGNAQYWLGESYLKRGRYAEAAGAFADGYKRYPKGAKAPEQLLGLASALGRENQKQNACVALAKLDHDFPHPGSTLRDRSAAEKKRLGC